MKSVFALSLFALSLASFSKERTSLPATGSLVKYTSQGPKSLSNTYLPATGSLFSHNK